MTDLCQLDVLKVLLALRVPIIGVGAPAKHFLAGVAAQLDTSLIVPEHSEVANAVGVMMGNVVETAELTIRVLGEGGYRLFSPWLCKTFPDLQAARTYALELGTSKLRQLVESNGASNINVTVHEQKSVIGVMYNCGRLTLALIYLLLLKMSYN